MVRWETWARLDYTSNVASVMSFSPVLLFAVGLFVVILETPRTDISSTVGVVSFASVLPSAVGPFMMILGTSISILISEVEDT